MIRKNLILGAMVGHDLHKIRPFVDSLRATPFDGDVVFFVSHLSSQTTSYLIRNRIILLDYPFEKTRDIISVHSFRFLLFYHFLNCNKAIYGNVMLTDTRDVLFQNDPFDYDLDDRLCVFLEDSSKTIGTCPYNSSWILKKYGRSELSLLNNCRISCSGVTIGCTAQILFYLSALHDHLVPPVCFIGDDQAGHNYLVHHNLLGPLRIMSNMDGPVLTMGYMPAARIFRDKLGRIVDANGHVINVLHQYDRHPDFMQETAFFKIVSPHERFSPEKGKCSIQGH
jgi:hypothetical protein